MNSAVKIMKILDFLHMTVLIIMNNNILYNWEENDNGFNIYNLLNMRKIIN